MPPGASISYVDTKTALRCELRREMRIRRASLSDQLRSTFDEAIRQHVLQLVQSQKARSIACYWSFNGEPDITPLCRQLMNEGFELALPVISKENDQLMQFHSWRPDTGLSKNKYGIFEPQETAPVPLAHFDLLLMPLVAYDRLGNRLGMGSGYYDHHLESLRHLPTPLRVGIAYNLQENEPMESNSWDISLHGVVNERGWYTFATQKPDGELNEILAG